MSTDAAPKVVREGQSRKRTAIIAAARELFVTDGFERTSMDAVAAQAGVSKRTVYDYFGDKRRLLIAVVENAGESLLAAMRHSIDENLSDEADIPDVPALEQALARFAIDLSTSLLASADYAAVLTLIASERALLVELANHPLATAPEEGLAERFAHFAERGLLETEKPRLAADHFNALTTGLAVAYNNETDPARASAAEVRRIMTDGVHAFIRAYGRRDGD